MSVPAVRQKPRRFDRPGAPDLRAALLAVVAGKSAGNARAYALLFALRALETLAKNSPGPAQREYAAAHVEAFEDLIPTDVRDAFEAAANRKNR